MGLDTVSQNVLGLVALFVSFVALVTTVLQVLQQFFLSAEGYRRCAESVMGLWSEGTHRKLRVYELRVEVVFETPVIFLAPPDNMRGPILERKIHYIDGTSKSYSNTRVMGESAQKKADEQASARVHTADDERASWVTLLSTLQKEERESRQWDEQMRVKSHAGSRLNPPTYGLTVGLQTKTRSWDFIPASITKPYATSAICHLVEMMTMLGMYWKVFDQILWNLRAEGNGFILTSTTVHGLGVMVVFAITGKSRFSDNRVIPTVSVKELCFGTVPNIFDDMDYLNREKDAQSLNLEFGTSDKVATTLESLGCTSETLKRYERDHKHIFSVSFEIIGMLGKVFRIRGSNFRMIPNPTRDPWLKKNGPKASWKITRLMEVFQGKLSSICPAEKYASDHPIAAISDRLQSILSHNCIQIILLNNCVQRMKCIKSCNCTDEANLSIDAREEIHDALDQVTQYLLLRKQEDVLSVVVAHLTKVLEILDDPGSPLNSIVLAHKEEALLNYYFNHIRPAVMGHLDHDRRTKASNDDMEQRNAIWIALIFRMLCWLLIHDFDKADVNIVPSDLKGSRMPVYIG